LKTYDENESIFQLKYFQLTIYVKSPPPPNNVGSGKVDSQHMSPKHQHCIGGGGGGGQFENLITPLFFFQDCRLAFANWSDDEFEK
jgi:hypothetical protein